MSRALVTGATGTVGAATVAQLRRRGAAVRAFVRDPGRARAALGDDVQLAPGDFERPDSLAAALGDVGRVVLCSGNHPRQAEHEAAVIDAAAAAGVERIVKVSTVGARAGSPEPFADAHGRAEGHLGRSGVPAVVLRSGFLMSNLLPAAAQAAATGTIAAPAGDARIAMIDPRDVAAVAAAVLLGDRRHEGRAYELTGPEALTYAEAAEHLAAALGRPVAFVDVPDDAARDEMVRAGLPPWMAEGVVGAHRQLREGVNAQVTDVVRVLTGRGPRTLARFLRDHVGEPPGPSDGPPMVVAAS